jgi:hypothetical protein
MAKITPLMAELTMDAVSSEVATCFKGNAMNDVESLKYKYKPMVHLWPITVEIYPTGQVAFIARPMDFTGKRWNRTFSTSRFDSPEECVKRAIDFCSGILTGTDDEVKKHVIEREHKKAARYGLTKEEVALYLEAKQRGIDVDKVLKDELERATLARLQAKWGNQK